MLIKPFPNENPSTKTRFYREAVERRYPDGRISLDAGAGNDRINVSKAGINRYQVAVNGQNFFYSRAEMGRLDIHAGTGHDRVTIDRNVRVPVRVHGDAGNDQITSYGSQGRLFGGSGHDNIHAYGSDNYVLGGNGNDVLRAQGDRNTLAGGYGNDSVSARGRNNFVTAGLLRWLRLR